MEITNKEIEALRYYVKKRYDDAGMDAKSFDLDSHIDRKLTLSENTAIINGLLPIPQKLKKPDNRREKKEIEAKQEEFEKFEQQAKLKFEQQLEKIANTPNSELLNRLYYVPRQFIKMVLEKKSRGLLLYGEAGLGKTFNVKKQLAEHNLKEGQDFNFICGHITAMSFYKKLYYNREKLIILDDINILESKINLNMLKASLSDGLVEYTSSALKDVPSQFQFSGQIIILLNDKPKNNEHLKAVESRILSYHLEMDYQTKIQTLYDIAKVDYEGLSLAERQSIVKWIKDNTNEATKNLSIRLLFMLFEFYKFDKSNWVILGKSYIQDDENVSLIINGITDKEFCEKTGLSRRTYYNLKKIIPHGRTSI